MGFEEILVIAVVILVLFGAKRIPEMMKGLGNGLREFNSEKNKPAGTDKEEEKLPEE